MRFVDEYRAPEQVLQLVEHLQERARLLVHTAARPLRIMEVCGGHTHAIFKFGLDQLLPENIEFIHGPGCPVCVLPMGRIDACIEIAGRPGVIFCTFGDAMRVPEKTAPCCRQNRAGPTCASSIRRSMPLKLAQQNPDREVVFFGLGFETTMPATALTCARRANAASITSSFSASTSPCSRPCAACSIRRTTASTPFSPPVTSAWSLVPKPTGLSPATTGGR
ncbi:Hydrogenase isoenzymes formation protein hypD [Raoultella terrigena]|uniref:Hydrogenase isoenzymes formation protein hypD n=1 Tax=Raoultella terrigena TaxID=577 RepID=A0A3P8JEG8_RAOTE|nr:Hydrogenase isoenzymes formation protein hypD [Raoultella terrigena]